MDLGKFLFIDTSLPNSIFLGLLNAQGDNWEKFYEEKEAALQGLFSGLEKLPAFPPKGFLFCQGPGSILGVRIAAIAIRTWLAAGINVPVLRFSSLSLHAKLIQRAFPEEKDFTLIAESRMNSLNILKVTNGILDSNFSEIKSAELQGKIHGKSFVLPHKKIIKNLPEDAQDYVPEKFLAQDPKIFLECPELFQDCGNTPDAINTASADSYVKWVPSRHK